MGHLPYFIIIHSDLKKNQQHSYILLQNIRMNENNLINLAKLLGH